MSDAIQTEVVIVGGGPVGMLLASELGLMGVDVVVLERRAEVTAEPRAGTLHARTLQLLARRGFVGAGDVDDVDGINSVAYFFAGVPCLTISAPASEPRPVLNIPQAQLERMFERRARSNGALILREHEVVRAAQCADTVCVEVATAEQAGATLVISGSYLVGADGPRGVVRQSLGFGSEVHAPTLDGWIAKVRLVDPEAAPMGFQRTHRGWTRIDQHVAGGHSRVMTFCFDGPAPDRHAALTLEEFHARFERISGRAVPMADAQFLGRFSDYSRCVHEYQRGRVLLAGDAAHVHFPIGGQGLNLGIQDAFNLGWKLAAALTSGEDRLLKSYHDERRERARRVVMNTRAQVSLMRPGSEAEPLRDLMAELVGTGAAGERLAGMISGQEIAYGMSEGRGAGEFERNRAVRSASARTSLAQVLEAGRAVLIAEDPGGLACAGLSERWEGVVRVAVWESAAESHRRAVLVRPDGYLAWAGWLRNGGSGAVDRILGEWYGDPERARGRRAAASAAGCRGSGRSAVDRSGGCAPRAFDAAMRNEEEGNAA